MSKRTLSESIWYGEYNTDPIWADIGYQLMTKVINSDVSSVITDHIHGYVGYLVRIPIRGALLEHLNHSINRINLNEKE